MNPEKAKNVNDIEGTVMNWKAEIRRLREAHRQGDREMLENEDIMCTILIKLCPDLEKELTDHLIKAEQKKSG